MDMRWRTVLFVCVENSFRSQMAEAYFNRYRPEGWRAVSAGIKPAKAVHPNAVRLMREEGIDISDKKPRMLTADMQREADLAVIVCSGRECPLASARYVEEWNIPDPAPMSLEEARRIRDAIKGKVLDLVGRIERGEVPPAAGWRLKI